MRRYIGGHGRVGEDMVEREELDWFEGWESTNG